MNWERDPLLDSVKSVTDKGVYTCVRNYVDMSVLWLDGVKLGVFGGGSHERAKRFAEAHFAKET